MLKKKIEKALEFIDVGETVVASAGMTFLCIRNVVMNGSGEIAYTNGREYRCHYEGCLTDDNYDSGHVTPNEFLSEYFKVGVYKK